MNAAQDQSEDDPLSPWTSPARVERQPDSKPASILVHLTATLHTHTHMSTSNNIHYCIFQMPREHAVQLLQQRNQGVPADDYIDLTGTFKSSPTTSPYITNLFQMTRIFRSFSFFFSGDNDEDKF
jgi:hypothetical protein